MNLTDEQIFQTCIEKDLNIMSYCQVNRLRIWSDIWEGSRNAECYSFTSKLALSSDDFSLCNDNSSTSYDLCIPREIRAFCPQRTAFFSSYVFQLQQFFLEFSERAIKVIPSESFFENPVGVMQSLEEFLGISHKSVEWEPVVQNIYGMATPNSLLSSNTQEALTSNFKNNFEMAKIFETSNYPPLSAELRKNLLLQFKPYTDLLQKLIPHVHFTW